MYTAAHHCCTVEQMCTTGMLHCLIIFGFFGRLNLCYLNTVSKLVKPACLYCRTLAFLVMHKLFCRFRLIFRAMICKPSSILSSWLFLEESPPCLIFLVVIIFLHLKIFVSLCGRHCSLPNLFLQT